MKLKSLNITSPRQNASRLALLAAGVCLLIMLFMMPSIDEDNAIYHNGAIVAMNAYFILLVSGFLLRVWPIPPETLVGSKNLKHYHEFLQAHKHTPVSYTHLTLPTNREV